MQHELLHHCFQALDAFLFGKDGSPCFIVICRSRYVGSAEGLIAMALNFVSGNKHRESRARVKSG